MINSKIFFLLFALVIAFRVSAHEDEHVCGHKQETAPEFLKIDEDILSMQEGRVLTSNEYSNIRIYPYFEFLSTAPSSYKFYIQNELVPSVISWVQGALKVKYPIIGNLKVTSAVESICGRDVPEVLLNTGVPADLFVSFSSIVQETNTVAGSTLCYLASDTKRPLIAETTFNRNMFVEANGDVLLHEKNIYLLIHEFFHILGFTSTTFPFFLDENGLTRTGHILSRTLNGKNATVLNVEPLTKRLREFYGCPTIEGAYLENDGGSGTAGSHFEKRFFLYEAMATGGIYGRRVSQFSLAVLEGSGWYIPDYNYAEPFFFGQGQGCGFLDATASNGAAQYQEFCTGNSRGCAPHGRAGGRCTADPKTEGFRYILPDIDHDCENSDGADNTRLSALQVFGRGAGSKCFTGDLNTRQSKHGQTSFCFKHTCSGSGSATQLEIQIGNNKVVCTEEGQKTVNGFYGSVDCPDPLQFCSTVGKSYCPRNCMGRGECVNNRCQCNLGFTGIDCALRR